MARRALVAAFALSALACASGRVVETRRTTEGPFEIETLVKRISSGGFPNTSGNPFATMPVTYFRLRHHGRPVPVAGEADPEFWDARFLAGAPRASVLLATDDVFLVVDGEGGLDVRRLADGTGAMATYQWLDGPGGEPGAERTIGIHDGSDEPRTLAGGTLLLVSGRTVLDVPTLRTHTFRLNDSDVLRALDEFHAAGSPVRALSPGRTQLVAVGSRSRDAGYEWALVVMDFARGAAYALPFDRDATRFEEPDDATPAWIEHYFHWTKGPDGERLVARRPVTPLPWVGRFKRTSPGVVDYDLRPVKAEMQRALLDFLVGELGATLEPKADDPYTVHATIDGVPLTIWYRPEAREVALFTSSGDAAARAAAPATIERIGARFDAELRAGRHQALFDSFSGLGG